MSEINIYAVIPKTLGRFTGHTDKKGKEIFEGDIVVWDYDTSDFDDSTYTPELVKWNDEVAGFADEYGAYWDKNYKIIGNIHDNPELLKDN